MRSIDPKDLALDAVVQSPRAFRPNRGPVPPGVRRTRSRQRRRILREVRRGPVLSWGMRDDGGSSTDIRRFKMRRRVYHANSSPPERRRARTAARACERSESDLLKAGWRCVSATLRDTADSVHDPRVSASRAPSSSTSTPPTQPRSVGVGVRTLVVLLLETLHVAEACDTLGDGRALALVREQSVTARTTVEEEGGAVMRERGDVIVACFPSTTAAAQAFDTISARVSAHCESHGAPLRIRGVVIEGPFLAVGANDGVELFGRTLRRGLDALRTVSASTLRTSHVEAIHARVA